MSRDLGSSSIRLFATPILAPGSAARSAAAAAAWPRRRPANARTASAGDFFCGGQAPRT